MKVIFKSKKMVFGKPEGFLNSGQIRKTSYKTVKKTPAVRRFIKGNRMSKSNHSRRVVAVNHFVCPIVGVEHVSINFEKLQKTSFKGRPRGKVVAIRSVNRWLVYRNPKINQVPETGRDFGNVMRELFGRFFRRPPA